MAAWELFIGLDLDFQVERGESDEFGSAIDEAVGDGGVGMYVPFGAG